jgi:hypothetical protein
MLEGVKAEDSHVRPGLARLRRASAVVINPATRTRSSRRRCSLTAEACSVQEHRTDRRVNLARGFFGRTSFWLTSHSHRRERAVPEIASSDLFSCRWGSDSEP